MRCDADLTATTPPGLTLAGFCADADRTIALIAPDEPAFWSVFTAAPEYRDGRADPMDRWSKRIIGAWAGRIGGRAVFPSDGPPFPPFIAWALATGRVWSSPVGLLVHDRLGLWLSFRGALILPGRIPQPPPAARPCDDCAQPCRDACPAGAFAAGYDVAACHDHLDRPAGRSCLDFGCRVRDACPISKGCGRLPEQSAWHMRQFHP